VCRIGRDPRGVDRFRAAGRPDHDRGFAYDAVRADRGRHTRHSQRRRDDFTLTVARVRQVRPHPIRRARRVERDAGFRGGTRQRLRAESDGKLGEICVARPDDGVVHVQAPVRGFIMHVVVNRRPETRDPRANTAVGEALAHKLTA
jgi:hypothetical protein